MKFLFSVVRGVWGGVSNPNSVIAETAAMVVVYGTIAQIAYDNLQKRRMKNIGAIELQKYILALQSEENTSQRDSFLNFHKMGVRIRTFTQKLDHMLFQGNEIGHLTRTAQELHTLLTERRGRERREKERREVVVGKKFYPAVTNDYEASIERCRRKLRAHIAEMHCALIVIYLAWHLSGLRDLHTGVTDHHKAVELLEPLKQEFPILSYADFYQLAGVVAVEIAGGPEIPFHPGRLDRSGAPLELISPPPLSYKDVVALAGARVLAMSNDNSNYIAFDNAHFKELLKGNFQIPMDRVIIETRLTRQLVDIYAADEDSFFRDYITVHLKLSENWFADAE